MSLIDGRTVGGDHGTGQGVSGSAVDTSEDVGVGIRCGVVVDVKRKDGAEVLGAEGLVTGGRHRAGPSAR